MVFDILSPGPCGGKAFTAKDLRNLASCADPSEYLRMTAASVSIHHSDFVIHHFPVP
jgi:hypothetical protein